MDHFVWLAVLAVSVAIKSSCETVHIVPINSSETCEVEPCFTLDQFAREAVNQNFNNLTLYFTDGKHSLKENLSISYAEHLKLAGRSHYSELWFPEYHNVLMISNVRFLDILNMTLISSAPQGENTQIQIDKSDKFVLNSCNIQRVTLQVHSTNTTMTDCTLDGKQSLGILALMYTDSLYIIRSKFKFGIHFLVKLHVYIKDCNFISINKLGSMILLGKFIYIDNCKIKSNRDKAIEIFQARKTVILNSIFTNNTSWFDEAVTIQSEYLQVNNCTFNKNINSIIRTNCNYIQIINSKFIDNQSDRCTTVHFEATNILYINESSFLNNRGIEGGGITITTLTRMSVFITSCLFRGNFANTDGGAIYFLSTSVMTTISDCIFENNTAELGGAININGHFYITDCIFMNNNALEAGYGAAIYIYFSYQPPKEISVIQSTLFQSNNGVGVVAVVERKVNMGNTTFLNNGNMTMEKDSVDKNSCIYLFNSRVDITGPLTLSGNLGGAIHSIQGRIIINSTKTIVISNNSASSGGGIMLRESELIIRSPVNISYNKAERFGGGIYAYQSTIDCKLENELNQKKSDEIFIMNNIAGQNGGGMHAVASTIKLTYSFVNIGFNTAHLSGGGLYLQQNSKIYLLKQRAENFPNINIQLIIVNNSAIFGGGIYVADDSIAGNQQCQGAKQQHINHASVSPECFIQTVKLYQTTPLSILSFRINFINTFIINNTAKIGSALYGGLLDRCTVSTLAESYQLVKIGLQMIHKTVIISNGSIIASDPVRVVFCGYNNHSTVTTRKAEAFKISILAIDQVGNPVNATIHGSVVTESGVGRLKEGQTEQSVGNQCTELEYNVFSKDSSAKVELYADGPCANLGLSKLAFKVTFLPCTCPIGLQPSGSEIECECVCDQKLRPHQITNCSQQAETIQLETNLWIGVANSSNGTGYMIHDCPFDYCIGKPVNISLNSSKERDRQCAFNRSGILCGECQLEFSLLLSTSKCKKCLNIYLLLLIPFALTGIVLVAFILFFNTTIAAGTIHGLIFYSNLLPVSYFFPSSVLTVFISWVNLDLGIETCFYNGMNSQAQVFLQLVFPAYLFLLMFLIIFLSKYSNFFATLLSNRNPVAALCTLIFLSYSKLLHFIIAALQSTVLEFPNGSKHRVWLYDGNVQYFTPSHTPHFLAAAIIIIAGGLFTLLLFFAQWFSRCSKWKLMKWTRNTKYTAFMDAYYAPFTRKNRYWVGLLLFALILHNVIVAMASNEFLPVLSMGCIGISLLIFKLRKNKIYKTWTKNQLENAFLLNLIFLAVGTLYSQASETSHRIFILANISMGISACLFIIIVSFHSYKYVYLPSRFYKRHKIKIKEFFDTIKNSLKRGPKRQDREELVTDQGDALETHYTAMRSHQQREPDLDVLAPITTDDYRPAPPTQTAHPVTHSVVETEA